MGTDKFEVLDLSQNQLRARLPEALDVYITAMGYPRGTAHHRAPLWTEHLTRPGWSAVGAFSTRVPLPDPATLFGAQAWATWPVVGVGYGYRGDPQQWWYQQVTNGLRAAGWSAAEARVAMASYFELTELHVHPAWQGHRIGEQLLTRLLTGRGEQRVLLSTPEVHGEDNRAWRLYRRAGFVDLLRGFHFSGDSRPFAILTRDLHTPGRPGAR